MIYSFRSGRLLCLLCLTASLLISAASKAQNCNTWLRLPSQGSKVRIGDLDISGNQLTVEAMFNRTSPLNSGLYYGSLVSKHTTQSDVNYSLLPNGCEINTSGSGYQAIFQSCPLELNRTYHVAMVYNGITLKYYRDGFLLSEIPCTGNITTNSLSTTIGQIAGGGDPTINQFLGFVNEVRIWNVARTQAQIQTYMGTSLPAPASEPGLMAYYRFDNLINDQGNISWNGVSSGGAIASQTNPNCTFTPQFCNIPNPVVEAGFEIPATICKNTPFTITNTSVNPSSYFWNFCAAGGATLPTGVNLGNTGSALSAPVFSDIVSDNGNYYVFVSNNWPGGLVRLDFGNSLLNTPTVFSLGDAGGVIPFTAEGVQVVKNEGRWYAIMVGGDADNGIPSRVLKLDFGTDITNPAPVGTDWGNIGNLRYPTDLHLFNENGNWYGFTVNAQNSSITRFNFSASFNNIPTAVNLGNPGGFDFPTGINAIKVGNNWHVFVVNDKDISSLVRLDFGTSLLNTPVATDLGNPGGVLRKTRDIYLLRECGEINAFAVNGQGFHQLVRLNFNNNILSTPVASDLGNLGGMNFPHSISTLFREGNDLYSFVTNVNDGTLTRLRFAGCNSTNIANSTDAIPPSITYTEPGVYSINLTIDDGLPTQTSICKQIIVEDCLQEEDSIIVNDYAEVLAINLCNNSLTVENSAAFEVGDTVIIMQMKGAEIVTSNDASFGAITDYKNAGNYEFNLVKSVVGNEVGLLNIITRDYDPVTGIVQLIRVPYYNSLNTQEVITCLPWNGKVGGVIAFNVGGTLELNKNIDGSGRGFQGGLGVNTRSSNINCFTNDFVQSATSQLAARKGESIGLENPSIASGKGALAAGGGGGVDHNSGGGGGGNAGAGGFGGYQYDICGNSPFDNRGLGGRLLTYNNISNKVFPGSGGGAGHANNAENTDLPPSGGNGGAIVIITANQLVSNGFKISSNGKHGLSYKIDGGQTAHDGAGGGGAGGTILLNIDGFTDHVLVEAQGGNGADMNASVAQFGRVGPGGGGGGGVVWLKGPALLPGIILGLDGGTGGVLTADNDDKYGSTNGQQGLTVTNLLLPIDETLFVKNIDSVRMQNTPISCTGFDFEGLEFINHTPVVSWQWDFGDGNISATQNTTHTYVNDGNYTVKLKIIDANGCMDSVSRDFSVQALAPDFSYTQMVCDPLTLEFSGSGNNPTGTYWDFGDNSTTTDVQSPSHPYATTGDYLVRYAVGNGACTDTVEKWVSVNILYEDIILTHDTTICFGTTKLLRTVPSLDFCWTPINYLDDPLKANPITSTPEPITYYFTAAVTGDNLISNSDFSQGNTGFTSDYSFSSTDVNEGRYFVGPNPNAWHGGFSACNDHSSGSGNMMIINGSPEDGAIVWSQTITVSPNTNYAFSTWVQSVVASNPAQLQFSINGKPLGSNFTAAIQACTWSQFYTTWSSGSNTSAIISVVNRNTDLAGNDFALDDISFAPVFIKRDSVIITVDTPFVRATPDTDICPGSSLQLQATGAVSYVWTGENLNNATISNPMISAVNASSEYIVEGVTNWGCVGKDTVQVTALPLPDISISNDTTICKNTGVDLWIQGADSYVWTPDPTLNDAGTGDAFVFPTVPSTYFVTATGTNGCSLRDSVIVTLRPDAVFNASAAGPACFGDSTRLSASGGDLYNWQPVTGLGNPSVSNPNASPASSMTYTVTISESTCGESTSIAVPVTINQLPDVRASRSTDLDCSTAQSQLSASGARDYIWVPATNLNNASIRNPVANPRQTTEYVVKGTDLNGCSNTDTVVVRFALVNKGGYLMPSAFTPNNDGLNDCYGIGYWGFIENLEFSVFNRWGQRVFFTTDPTQCWDGTINGVKQDAGVFVYMIKANTTCEPSVFRKGTFVLIR